MSPARDLPGSATRGYSDADRVVATSPACNALATTGRRWRRDALLLAKAFEVVAHGSMATRLHQLYRGYSENQPNLARKH
jgi:hypothetical protein